MFPIKLRKKFHHHHERSISLDGILLEDSPAVGRFENGNKRIKHSLGKPCKKFKCTALQPWKSRMLRGQQWLPGKVLCLHVKALLTAVSTKTRIVHGHSIVKSSYFSQLDSYKSPALLFFEGCFDSVFSAAIIGYYRHLFIYNEVCVGSEGYLKTDLYVI